VTEADNSFERKEILRVVHSLASYRPSLIALQYVPPISTRYGANGRMPMSEEDEVFLEKSFQRTLIVCPPVLFLSTYLYYAV
jgi:hypothetical protein